MFMSESEQNPPRKNAHASRWWWIGGIALLLVVAASVTLGVVISRAQPIVRERGMETLSTKFKARDELDTFNVSLLQGLQVSGEGLRIFGAMDPNNHEPGIQPLIAVGEFRFRTGIGDLLHSPMHVDTVHVKGLQLNLPPREQRAEMHDMGPKGGKIKITVDKLICDDT